MRAKEKVVFFPFEISISIFLHISAWYQFVLTRKFVFKGVGKNLTSRANSLQAQVVLPRSFISNLSMTSFF